MAFMAVKKFFKKPQGPIRVHTLHSVAMSPPCLNPEQSLHISFIVYFPFNSLEEPRQVAPRLRPTLGVSGSSRLDPGETSLAQVRKRGGT